MGAKISIMSGQSKIFANEVIIASPSGFLKVRIDD